MTNEAKTFVMRDASVVTPSPRHPVTPSPLRAWCYLVWLCILRLARVRQMVVIALALLGLLVTIVGLITLAGRSGMEKWRWPPPPSPTLTRRTFEEILQEMQLVPRVLPGPAPVVAFQDAIAGASETCIKASHFYLFSTRWVFMAFLGFLLPILSLSFATEALGGEREGRTLVWLLTRPLPRSSIYLAKFVALLPWSVGLNVGGFAVLCLAAGAPGRLAFQLYWPAVLGGTIAYGALFHLLAACFRRAAIAALLYSFFLEWLLGLMPGSMKRISLSFYTRCLMFDAAKPYGVQPEKPSIYLPVDASTAWTVLAVATAAFLVIGMATFARSEYQDLM